MGMPSITIASTSTPKASAVAMLRPSSRRDSSPQSRNAAAANWP